MNWIDTHSHLTYPDYPDPIEAVLDRSRAAGVTRWITVGTDAEHNRKAIDLAARFEEMFAVVGIHPHHASESSDDDLALLADQARESKVVAIGETGLDFHYNFSTKDRQVEVFRAELSLAAERGLPIVVHSRDAFADTIAILDEFAARLPRVVFHCHGGPVDQTQAILDRGWLVSFTGIVTFKNGAVARQSAAMTPLDRMMLETDCPFISPDPVRHIRPCEPAMLVHTARKLAELKGISIDDFALSIAETSRRFFGV
jgi:TatD DNase family protein